MGCALNVDESQSASLLSSSRAMSFIIPNVLTETHALLNIINSNSDSLPVSFYAIIIVLVPNWLFMAVYVYGENKSIALVLFFSFPCLVCLTVFMMNQLDLYL